MIIKYYNVTCGSTVLLQAGRFTRRTYRRTGKNLQKSVVVKPTSILGK